MVNNIACITCFYNFYNCSLQECNLHSFIQHMSEFNVPVYGVELVLPNQTPATTCYPNWRQVVGEDDSILWQKEALLNLAEKIVPEEYTVLAWVDADIQFENKKWVDDLYTQLEFCDFVQLFTQAHWLDADNNIDQTLPTVINYNPTVWAGHPGFAWSCTRKTWRQIGGLYERCISGGGDRVIAAAITEKMGFIYKKLNKYIGSDQSFFIEWCSHVRGRISSNIPGDVYHKFHGTASNRQYDTRKKYTPSIDAFKDVVKDKDGVLRWNSNVSDEIKQHFKYYFLKRKVEQHE